MPEQTPMPEPPDRALVMVGPDRQERMFVRDDRGLRRDDEMRWWLVDGTAQDAGYRWSEVAAYGNVVRLYRQSEVDEAVWAAGVTPVGAHLKEPGGYCRSCGHAHAETEWARIHDQAAEEDR